MTLGMIGLGRMGGNIARRLMRGGHEVVAFDRNAEAVQALAADGAEPASSIAEMRAKLDRPAIYWVMLPAGGPTEDTIAEITAECGADTIVIDGGNSFYKDDIRRAKTLAEKGAKYVDVGTSGGVWGLERGYCMMIGGDKGTVDSLDPIFETLAPGVGTIPRTPGRTDAADPRAEQGYIHAGPAGAGHFVKMVHNGIEYGLMQAYAEGYEILDSSGLGIDAEAALSAWRQGSVVRSWLLDLLVAALERTPDLEGIRGVAMDSGEGRWTVNEAVRLGVPAPVISAALFARFSSQKESSTAMKVVAALRREFGGHAVEVEQ